MRGNLQNYRRNASYVPAGGLGDAGDNQVIEMAFWYSLTATLVASTGAGTLGPQQTLAVSINADSNFMCLWLIANSTGAFQFSWQDNATGRSFTNGLLNNVNIFGTAQQPFPMLPPYTFQQQGSIGVTLGDFSGATNVVQLTFTGKKIFPSQTASSAGDIQAG
jgi:hypothetical protein